MKTNKLIAWSLIAVTAIGSAACTDEFLEEHYTTEKSTQYFDTPEGLESLTVTLYANCRYFFGYDWAYSQVLYGTDEFTTGNDLTCEPWNTYDVRLTPSKATPATGAANNNCTDPAVWWDQLYYGIASANMVIDRAHIITDEAVRNRCLAQAHFLRGYNYYRLTAQYGGCVLQLKPAAGVVRTFTRSSEWECWEQVINDLRKSVEYFEHDPLNGGYRYGKGVTWTKGTASHFLAKALMFRASERVQKNCPEWTEEQAKKDLEEAIEACTYTIGERGGKLADNYSDLYARWTGVDCAIESLDEILMAAPWDGTTNGGSKGRYGNRTSAYFSSQFGANGGFVASWSPRGEWSGKDFQRCLPTEYTYGIYDHVNDARLWKTFQTVYGICKLAITKAPEKPNDLNREDFDSDDAYNKAVKEQQEAYQNDLDYWNNYQSKVALGDPSTVFILNSKDDHTYDSYTFGAEQQHPTFTDDNGRLPKWGNEDKAHNGAQDYLGHTTFTDKKGQWMPAASVLYQNGKYVMMGFKSQDRCNMFAGINKTVDGTRSGTPDDSYRDVTMARLAETFLNRAECYARLGQYGPAMEDINVVRKRAQWQNGENRSYYEDGNNAYETCSTSHNDASKASYKNFTLKMNTYYLSNPGLDETTEASDLMLKSFPNSLPAEDEAVLSALGVSDAKDRAINFILNERTRELIGEWQRWETLSRTETLISRAKAFNPDAAPNITAGKHEYRPIPQTFLNGLLHEDGTNLTDAEKAAWQNPGW